MKFITAKTAIQQVINVFIVYLNILTFYFKIDITDVLIFKHSIVVV